MISYLFVWLHNYFFIICLFVCLFAKVPVPIYLLNFNDPREWEKS